MVYFVTALMIEAAPIIEHFKLKKDLSIHAYQVYCSQDMALIISGVGKIKSAMAVVYLLSLYKVNKSAEKDFLINIGFCGESSCKYNMGSLLRINKITDMDTGYDYYPDVFYGNNVPEEALCCYSRPLKKDDYKDGAGVFCDMESSGIMEASKKFLYAHQVIILKVVSDFLSPENLNKDMLKGFIKKELPLIQQLIDEFRKLNKSSSEDLSETEKNMLITVAMNLRFSEAMKVITYKNVKKAKLLGMNPLKILECYSDININSKSEGKKVFEHINEKLKQKPV